MIEITNHAYERARERCSLKEKSLNALATKAYEHGLHHKDTSGQLHKYITKLYLTHRNANQIRVYGEYVYIFNNQILITVFCIPNNLKKQVLKHKERKNI